jgi:monofunctional biosynthetic peptidoglycan transglycosylase
VPAILLRWRGRRGRTLQARPPKRARGTRRLRRWLWRIPLALVVIPLLALAVAAGWLVALRAIDPPTTGVQVQRRIESWLSGQPYRKQYEPVSLEAMSAHLPHAVIAAEDTRFYDHAGIDWEAIEDAVEDNRRRKRRRGGSTISQQLAKNLFLTTHSNWVRKAAEVPLTYLVEAILPKERILELYLNVVEWGPEGLFGAEAAARHHYGVSASKLGREQSARLAACLPSPRRRSPQAMDRYGEIVMRRMTALGW